MDDVGDGEDYICRICGFESDAYFWKDGHPYGTICDRCGCESGDEDISPRDAYYTRVAWLSSKAAAAHPRRRLEHDITRIAPEWLDRRRIRGSFWERLLFPRPGSRRAHAWGQ